MTEDTYATNYFRKECSKLGNDEKVPIRWMAPESISVELSMMRNPMWSVAELLFLSHCYCLNE